MAVGLLLPYDQAIVLFAVLLGVAAGVYPGFAITAGREVLREWTAALIFVAIALIGVWYEPAVLGLAWLGHAAWDYLHHRGLRDISAPRAYPVFCLYVDVWWGLFILLLRFSQ